jgi:hypothetical protein
MRHDRSTTASALAAPLLPQRRLQEPRTAPGRWLRSERMDEPHGAHRTQPWFRVLWLTGVDYFSTLGYQPGIALLAAGALSPLATLILIAVTLFGALPVYAQVASRSYAGQGSIAMLESLLSGWKAKFLVLLLLGFAATDFVITITLSASDAAQHAVENPFLHDLIGDRRLLVTLALLVPLAAVFLAGFGEAIGVAALVAVPYLMLNLVVLARALYEVATHPTVLAHWREALALRGDPTALALASLLVFPKLALGLSGFETGVTVMSLVRGGAGDHDPDRVPWGRVHATRRLLLSAALVMSVMLVLSSFATTLLVPPEAYRSGGPANGRAVAWLAHEYLGDGFGSVYDASTILILWFAGASAMAGLLSIIPRYLPRYGMAPGFIAYRRPLVLVLFAICVLVTLVFRADVDKQGGAYATGVLVLIFSAALAVALSWWRERGEGNRGRKGAVSLYFWLVTGIFAFTLVDNVIERPDGVIVASFFIVLIVAVSALSRWILAKDLRVAHAHFADEESARLVPAITHKKVHLVPLRTATADARRKKAEELRRHYAIEGPLAFFHVRLLDNRSEYLAPLRLHVRREGEDYLLEVTGAVAIANTVAYVSELVDPKSLFLGLTRRNLMSQSLRHLLWGEGETGLLVYEILVRYWEWTPEEDVRPCIFLMSD